MRLVDALGVQRGDVVAFVGAGGKTSALFRLAGELVERGWRVITTTTTRMAASERLLAPVALTVNQIGHQLAAVLDEASHIFIYDRLDDKWGKVIGVDAGLISHLAQLADVILIEADGARRLPLKGPYSHEPVIPNSTTLVVPIAGLDVVGQPLDDDHVYGAENIRRYLGVSPTVDGALVGAILAHDLLGLKDVPDSAQVAALLNKHTPALDNIAEWAANAALSSERINRVLIGAVQQPDPVTRVRRRIGAVVLAAGLSRRMGQPKVLLPWGEGSTIIREIVRTTVQAKSFAEVIVITGQWDTDIRQQIADLPVRAVHNPRFDTGEMISSVQTGLRELSPHLGAALILLGDQPDLESTVIRQVLAAYAETLSPIVAPVYRGQRGHPVLFDRSLWTEILALPDKAAPRDALLAHPSEIQQVEVDTGSILQDIDTPRDYDRERPA
jgi:molybdenum cofactor cytidylyltransferase